MQKQKKKKITVGGIVVGSGTIFGLIVNVPQVIKTSLKKMPEWMANPDTWWVVAIAVAYGLFVLWVWGSPEESDDEKPDSAVAYKVSLRCGNLTGLYDDIMILHHAVLKKIALDGPKSVNREFVFQTLEVIFPPKIKSIVGKRAFDEYMNALNDARKKSNDPAIVCQAVIPVVKTRVMQEMDKEFTKYVENLG